MGRDGKNIFAIPSSLTVHHPVTGSLVSLLKVWVVGFILGFWIVSLTQTKLIIWLDT